MSVLSLRNFYRFASFFSHQTGSKPNQTSSKEIFFFQTGPLIPERPRAVFLIICAGKTIPKWLRGKPEVCFLFVSFRQKTDATNHAILRIKALGYFQLSPQAFFEYFSGIDFHSQTIMLEVQGI